MAVKYVNTMKSCRGLGAIILVRLLLRSQSSKWHYRNRTILFGRGRTSITAAASASDVYTYYCAALARKPRGTNRMRSVGPEDARLVAHAPDA